MERLIVWHRWLPPAELRSDTLMLAHAARDRAVDALTREGARILCAPGQTLVCEVDPAYLVTVTEACLALLDAFDSEARNRAGSLTIALVFDALLPSMAGEEAAPASDAIDRAQALANRALPGELVLGGGAEANTATTFLFGRELSVSPGVDGQVIDRAFPRRRACRAGLTRLAAPSMPPGAQAPFQALRHAATAEGRHRLVVMGPYGAGVDAWLCHLAHEVRPPLWLHITAVAAPLAPLCSLAYALRRAREEGRAPEQLLDPNLPDDSRAIEVLAQVRDGRPVSRRDTITALRHLFVRVPERHGTRAWISVSPLPLVDPATVSVITDSLRDCESAHFLVLRTAFDTKAPEALVRCGDLTEIHLPALGQTDAHALAQSMLGLGAAADIARRAAAMGGATALGIAEAVRVLVSSGDVIHDGETFRWRRGPAGRVTGMSVDEMIEERVDQLDDDARRVLDTLASVPDPAESGLVDEVRSADGVTTEVYHAAVERLVSESLIERRGRTLAMTSGVRARVEQNMPPARLSEVHRFVAEALSRALSPDQEFARATLAYYVARGGNPEAAVDILLEVARAAGQLGFVRSAVRLAAAAVECDPTGDTRDRASQIAQALSARATSPLTRPTPPPGDVASEPVLPFAEQPRQPFSTQAMHQAIDAIMARDYEAVERSLEFLVAAGHDGPAIDRLRAMTLLSRGDRTGALRTLRRARQRSPLPFSDTPRAALAMALVMLDGGEVGEAVREALRALARTRDLGETGGEGPTLRTLAVCYRRLGREADARQLDEAAQKRADLQAAPQSGSPGP